MKATTRIIVVFVAAFVALASAGATVVYAATNEDTLGASVESRVYTSDSPTLYFANKSTVEARFEFTPTGGWKVEPSSIVLAPDAHGTVTVAGDGEDGAVINVRIVSAAPVPQGVSQGAIAMQTKVFHYRPFDPMSIIGPVLEGLVILLIVVLSAWRWKPWQLRLARAR